MVVLILFFALVALCLLTGRSVAWAMAGGLLLFYLRGRRQGFSPRRLWGMAWKQGKKALTVVRILVLIGAVTGLWRLGGTIPGAIVWGLHWAPPRLFLAAAFLLTALLSYILGTSYGVCSTLGVILMALARSGGVSVPLAAGAVLSGAYFGDRCSPASSAAALVAAVTDTSLYGNVKAMLRTGALPTALALALFGALSWFHPLSRVDGGVLSALEERFTLTWPVLLPAAILLILPLCRVPAAWAMGLSLAASAILAVVLQGFTPLQALLAVWRGYHPSDGALALALSGGGIASMLEACLVVLLTGLYAGILDGTGGLDGLSGRVEALSRRLGRFPAMCLVSLLVASILCNQAVTSMLGVQLLQRNYRSREELAIDMENSGVMLAGLVPWSVASSVPLAMLGADARALPFALLLWLTPLCYLFTKRFFYGTPDSIPAHV